MRPTWMVIANASEARIFERTPSNGQDWKLREQLSWPRSRLKTSELVTDKPGSNLDGPSSRGATGAGGAPGSSRQPSTGGDRTPGNLTPGAAGAPRSAVEPRTDPQDVEKERFSRQLTDLLRDNATRQRFDSLVIVAPPEFLGLVRKNLDAPLEQRLVATLNKDYTGVPDHEVTEQVCKHVDLN